MLQSTVLQLPPPEDQLPLPVTQQQQEQQQHGPGYVERHVVYASQQLFTQEPEQACVPHCAPRGISRTWSGQMQGGSVPALSFTDPSHISETFDRPHSGDQEGVNSGVPDKEPPQPTLSGKLFQQLNPPMCFLPLSESVQTTLSEFIHTLMAIEVRSRGHIGLSVL